jgi:hypothetical protein
VTATLQRHSVVRSSVAQPRRVGIKRPDVTQLAFAQDGKFERETIAVLSFVGTLVSRARIAGPGKAAAYGRVIVAIVIMREVECMASV